MGLEKGQRMPNASDFSRGVDIASESSINGGNLPELELNSHIFVGERLTIYALIVAQRSRVCRLWRRRKLSPVNIIDPTASSDSLRQAHEEQTGRAL